MIGFHKVLALTRLKICGIIKTKTFRFSNVEELWLDVNDIWQNIEPEYCLTDIYEFKDLDVEILNISYLFINMNINASLNNVITKINL